MTRSYLLLPVLAGLICFYSCKKDSSAKTPGVTVYLPRAVVEEVHSAGIGSDRDSSLYYYDGGNRIDSMVSATTPGFRLVYAYNGETSFTLDIIQNGSVEIHEIFFINSDHLVDSTAQRNDTGDSTTEKYVYNGSKQLTEQREYSKEPAEPWSLDNTTTYTYDGNGDAIAQTDDNGQIRNEYSDQVNPLGTGLIYLPVPKYLVKTQTIVQGGTTGTVTHSYTFDSNNRLITDASAASDGGMDVKTYYY